MTERWCRLCYPDMPGADALCPDCDVVTKARRHPAPRPPTRFERRLDEIRRGELNVDAEIQEMLGGPKHRPRRRPRW